MKVLATFTEVSDTERTIVNEATFDDIEDALSFARQVQQDRPELDWVVTKDKKVVDTNAWEDYI